jgi:hypothetical protein
MAWSLPSLFSGTEESSDSAKDLSSEIAKCWRKDDQGYGQLLEMLIAIFPVFEVSNYIILHQPCDFADALGDGAGGLES